MIMKYELSIRHAKEIQLYCLKYCYPMKYFRDMKVKDDLGKYKEEFSNFHKKRVKDNIKDCNKNNLKIIKQTKDQEFLKLQSVEIINLDLFKLMDISKLIKAGLKEAKMRRGV